MREVAIAVTLALSASACGGKSSKNDADPEGGGAKPVGGHVGGLLIATGGVGSAAVANGGRASGGTASSGATGGAQSSGGAATGGIASGMAGSGMAGSGIASGGTTSGGAPNNNAGAPCTSPDGGIPIDSRACLADSDCALRILPGCCAADHAAGVAKDLVCSAIPPDCTAVDCGKLQGFVTDNGQQTLDQTEIRVRCQPVEPGAGLCSTSLIGSDTVMCGAAICDAGELCVHLSSRGGTAPRCFPLPADGACPPDSEYAMDCDGAPGCRELLLTPEPYCTPIPPGCGAPTACSCLPPDFCGGQRCRGVMGHQVDCFYDAL